MFDAIEQPSLGSWWLRFLTQGFLCYVAMCAATIPVGAFLELFGMDGGHGPAIHFVGNTCLVLLCLGAACGWAAASRNLSLRSPGMWIWVLPVVLTLSDIYGDFKRPIPWPPESLFTTPGEGVFGPYLLGLPAFANAGYSIGAWIAPRKWDGRLFTLAGIGLVITLLGLFWFEAESMAQWSVIREVADRPGLWLSADRSSLCKTQTGGVLVPNFTYIRLLGERRSCAGDERLSRQDSGPEGSFVLDRVVVVNGAHAGQQGWMLEYGLLEPLR